MSARFKSSGIRMTPRGGPASARVVDANIPRAVGDTPIVVTRGRRRGGTAMATTPERHRTRAEAIIGRAAHTAVSRAHWEHPDEVARRTALLEQAEQAVVESPLVAVLVPVLSRPDRVAHLVESFQRATSADDARLYFIAQRSDGAEIEAIRRVGMEPILVEDGDRNWARKINRGYSSTTEPWLLLGADDLGFHPGWIDVVRPMLSSFAGVIGTNDMGNPNTMNGRHSTHPLVRRLYADICGTADERGKVLHEGYDHNYPDTELVATSRQRGLYVHRADCVVEHLHPHWGKGKEDAVYRLGRSKFQVDQGLFLQRGRVFGW